MSYVTKSSSALELINIALTRKERVVYRNTDIPRTLVAHYVGRYLLTFHSLGVSFDQRASASPPNVLAKSNSEISSSLGELYVIHFGVNIFPAGFPLLFQLDRPRICFMNHN